MAFWNVSTWRQRLESFHTDKYKTKQKKKKKKKNEKKKII